MLTCPAAHIGAQAYAVLIDSYGGYILESFAAHSVKNHINTKGKEVQKKGKKTTPKEKGKEKKEGEKNSEVLASCLVLVLRNCCLLN